MDGLSWNRFQFGFTITYHYLFPQLTMGLALIILICKWLAYRKQNELYNDTARFWGRIFGINFALGVVTGIPMEFQFGTNWARFSDYAGGVIGLTLAMEGMFAFFAESAFLGLFLFGEKRLGPKGHLGATFMLFLGAWLSGYFIITTNAFMQHPVGHSIGADGRLQLSNVAAYLFNPWAIVQYLHTMCGSVVTAAFVVTSVGAYWALMGHFKDHAATFLKVGVITGCIASVLQLFPTGDAHGKMVAQYQVPALAAMEGKFETSKPADLAIIGQPDVERRRLENPIMVPAVLSFLAYGSFGKEVKGLNDIPEELWPDNVELLYYAYHIMVGLGTMLIAIMGLSLLLLLTRRLTGFRPMLWVLLVAFPFPYIATTAGWLTAELGRQPWLVYGMQRTADGTSAHVNTGNVAFTTLGFMGMYLAIGFVFLFLVARSIARGPIPPERRAAAEAGGSIEADKASE